MLDAPLRRQVVKRPPVAESDELGALDEASGWTEYRVATREPRRDVVVHAPRLTLCVVELRANGHRDIGGKRPRRRRPHEQPVVRAIEQRQRDGDRLVGELGMGIQHLVLRDRGAAARAPRHRAMPLIQPAPLVASLEEGPVVFDVRIRHREVGIGPVHPLTELPRLFRLDGREALDALATGPSEAGEAERFDLSLRVEAQRLLDFDLDPEPLAIETVLEPLLVAAQGLVALDHILVGAAPRMMDPHGIVRGDRPVEEGEARTTTVLGHEARKDLVALPQLRHGPRNGDEVQWSWLREHACLPLCLVSTSPGSGGDAPNHARHGETKRPPGTLTAVT